MSGDAIVVVAPGDVDFSRAGALRHGPGVRAAAPHVCTSAPRHLALGSVSAWTPPSVRIFNVQGRGYADDNGIAWLTRDHGVVYEVPAQV